VDSWRFTVGRGERGRPGRDDRDARTADARNEGRWTGSGELLGTAARTSIGDSEGAGSFAKGTASRRDVRDAQTAA